MAIDAIYDRAIKAMDPAVKKNETKGIHRKAISVAPQDSGEDAVVIVDAGKLAKAKYIAETDPGVDFDKVNAIKQKLKDGTYTIDYKSIAQKLIESEKVMDSLF